MTGDEWTAEQRADSITPLEKGITPLEGAITPVQTVSTEQGATTISLQSDVLFAFGSAELSPTATAKIGELVRGIPAGTTVKVDGHTDSIGDDASNLELSRRRAETVAAAIRASGLDVTLEVAGHGESRPVAPNQSADKDNPEGREKNRRVTISYGG
ncbi:OmpA family protein [Propioniciclava coleopterorum]|uniref:OmpA family protein n=1 Tax=Propioniciclava coleopterorum TaxID=2714937 RepID=A0A6G7Y8J4_9ACTN|nr:OmpA family protein [Propioniciclava coleopterorum]QIK72951.1 OmpA family protein [Propioniciclava coleopterorum]